MTKAKRLAISMLESFSGQMKPCEAIHNFYTARKELRKELSSWNSLWSEMLLSMVDYLFVTFESTSEYDIEQFIEELNNGS